MDEAWFFRIKAATRDLVKACGGVVRAGDLASVSKSEVGRWQSPGDPGVIGIPAAMVLEAECGCAYVTAVMAENAGRRLVEADGAVSVADLLGRQGAVARSSAELVAEIAEAAADGRITAAEAERIDRCAGAVTRAVEPLRGDCATIRAGALKAVDGGRR